MSSDAPFLPVGTASVSFIDQQGTFALHVFSTDGYTVTDRVIGSGSQGWTNGAFNQPGSAVSATSWVDADGGHIRVYCTYEDATTEWCLDGTSSTSWYQGGYTLS